MSTRDLKRLCAPKEADEPADPKKPGAKKTPINKTKKIKPNGADMPQKIFRIIRALIAVREKSA